MSAVAAIAVGAALGAVLRWLLGLWLNALLPEVPPGTLAANVIGGYLIGLAMAYFAQHVHVPAELRLFVITGFLGGLTTFSTFSAEVMRLIQDGRLAAGDAGGDGDGDAGVAEVMRPECGQSHWQATQSTSRVAWAQNDTHKRRTRFAAARGVAWAG